MGREDGFISVPSLINKVILEYVNPNDDFVISQGFSTETDLLITHSHKIQQFICADL